MLSNLATYLKYPKRGSGDCPGMITYLLKHKYCKANLSFQLLKNYDRAVAGVLAQAKALIL